MRSSSCSIPTGGSNNNNGNLLGAQTYAGGPASQPSLTVFNDSQYYDAVNRLVASYGKDVNNAMLWVRTFNYDPYGNMSTTVNTGVPLYGTTPFAANGYNPYNPANNRLLSARYDAAGNQTEVGSYSVSYDAENRQTLAVDNVSEGQANYGYDGVGQRVTKSNNGLISTLYVYDIFGQLAAEYNSFPKQQSPCATCYLTYDHLGTARLVTDGLANVIARHDYLPFGEEIPANTAGRLVQWGPFSDKVNQKFTGQERDQETGLDFFQARYFYGAQGRFNSPDQPFADQFEGNPQGWNLYSYAHNNPLRNVDRTGMNCITFDNGSQGVDPGNPEGGCGSIDQNGNDSQPEQVNVYGNGGNQLGAFGLNLLFAVDNLANSYFGFIAPDSQLLSQTPTNRDFIGRLATGLAVVGTALIGPEGEAGNLIKLTEARLAKVLQSHTEGGLLSAGKSLFTAGEDVKNLIQAAASQPAIPQAGGNFERIVDAGRIIGIDRSTGVPTSVYTVITDGSGNLITAFPGRP